MNILPTDSMENEENAPPPSSTERPPTKQGVLKMSRRFPHSNSPSATKSGALHKNNDDKRQHSDINNYNNTKRHSHWQDRDNAISPKTMARRAEQSLADCGWSNNGNGVYIHDSRTKQHDNNKLYIHHDGQHQPSNVPNLHHNGRDTTFSSSIHQIGRTGLQRRFNNNHNNNPNNNTNEFDPQLSPDNRADCLNRRFPHSRVSSLRPKYLSTTTMKRRMVVLSGALALVIIGYFVEIHTIMNNTSSLSSYTGSGSSSTQTKSTTEWLMNLPSSLPILGGGGEGQQLNGDENDHILDEEVPIYIDIEKEMKKAYSSSKRRAEQRRMRTMPPSVYPTVPAASSSVATRETIEEPTTSTVEFAPPRLTLDLPAHRELNSDGTIGRRSLQVDETKSENEQPEDSSESIFSNMRRRLLNDTPQFPPICGRQAEEASQLNPQHYPPEARIGPKSRIVITGALSQVGMELILQLYEQCGVTDVVGLDSSYPNTRHDRVDMIESRYKYIQRRVPGFQRLMVPVFGIHPHPGIGEEVQFESTGQSFDLVSRLRPTHIVHLAGMEEGHGEHVDYGDTVDASPFSEMNGKSSMMRRFESLLSMEQVFRSVAKGEKSQPQVVYVSSNEAANLSGVSMMSDDADAGGSTVVSPHPASVYGTTSLLKEVLASYYHTHHAVDSVGLRVPTVFGPFSRPGSLMYDLAERTIRNAAGKDVDGVPKYHLDRDRYNLSSIASKREGAMLGAKEQVAFVYDVASAIVSAMQFKKNYNSPTMDPNGPTILRIGSKLTTSMEDLRDSFETLLPPHDQNDEAWPTSTDSTTSAGATQESSNAVAVLNSPGISIFDTERNRDLLGWTHKSKFEEGIKTMLAWHILKSYPYGLRDTVPAYSLFQNLLEDSLASLSYHSLPCASGCRWLGGMCSTSPWDGVIETTKEITRTCPYVLYTVDLRPELKVLEKQSSPSGRKGWEEWFCKIAFVSSSSKLAKIHYADELAANTPMDEWNGKNKQGQWIIVTLQGSQYTMPEFERSMAKLTPNNLFHEKVEKAMYVNHRRVILTTDQAVGVMQHLEMNERKSPEKKTIKDEKTGDNVDIWLPPHPHRHSVFFTNKYSFGEDYNTNSAKNLARFVMQSQGIAETKDIRAQVQFYEQTAHLTRTNMQRSPNYQEFYQENLFQYDFVRSTWLVHELKSEEGRNLRCEMYEEHSLWGNADMEDMSIGFVLARKKAKMQLGSMTDNRYKGPEEWYPLLEPRDPDDEDAITEGPVYLDYLEAAQKVSTDSKGHEFYVTFLPQKLKK